MCLKGIVRAFRIWQTLEAMDLLADGLQRKDPEFRGALSLEEVALNFIGSLDSAWKIEGDELLPRFVLFVNFAEAIDPPLEDLIAPFWKLAAEFTELTELTFDLKMAVCHFFELMCLRVGVKSLRQVVGVTGEIGERIRIKLNQDSKMKRMR